MNSIKMLAFSLFVCAVGCALGEELCQNDSLKKALKVCFTLLLTITLFSGFSASKIEISYPTVTFETYDGKQLYLQQVKAAFQEYLQKDYDENAVVIKIDSLNDEDGNIYITEVAVDSDLSDQTLNEIIRKEFGKYAVLVRDES